MALGAHPYDGWHHGALRLRRAWSLGLGRGAGVAARGVRRRVLECMPTAGVAARRPASAQARAAKERGAAMSRDTAAEYALYHRSGLAVCPGTLCVEGAQRP